MKQQNVVAILLGTLVYASSFTVSAAEQPVINWLNANTATSNQTAPFSIIISQPAPSLVFSGNQISTKVQLAFTKSSTAAAKHSINFNADGQITLANSLFASLQGKDQSATQLITSHSQAQNISTDSLSLPKLQEFNSLATSSALDKQTSETQPTWSVTVEVEQQLAASLAAIGQIHCTGGHFSPSGYTASGCQAASTGGNLRVGGQFAPTKGVELDLGLFSQSASSSTVGQLSPVEQGLYNASLAASPFTASEFSTDEANGLDMGFHLNTGDFSFGSIQLDLAMAEYFGQDSLKQSTVYDFKPPWLGTNDLERQAKVHLGWSKGAFSGGLEGIHQIYQTGALASDSNDWSTFNLYFSWQAPWNGRFSIGATNVLDNSLDEAGSQQSDPRQPLDGIFGRVPYVRYKHDL